MIEDSVIENFKLSHNISLWECVYGTNRDAPDELVQLIKKHLTWDHIYNLIGVASEWQNARDFFNDSVIIHWGGGFRPVPWEHLKGRSGLSQHVEGRAIDAHLQNTDLIRAYDFFERAYKRGGRGLHTSENFVHKDTRTAYAVWEY